MGEKHVTKRLLETLQSGELPSRDDFEELVRHLAEKCADCRAVVESTTAATYAEALARAKATYKSLPELRSAAKRDFRALLKLDRHQRLLKIKRALTRYSNPALVDLLLEESKQVLRSDPYEAEAFAECAFAVSLRIPTSEAIPPTWVMTCVARSEAYRGNALRLQGDVRGAEQLLNVAGELFQREGNGDPLVEAELYRFLASLRVKQHRYPEATDLLDSVLAIYDECQDEFLLGEALIKKATVLCFVGEHEEAITTIRAAIEFIDERAHPQTYLGALHNLAYYLEANGQYREARVLLLENRELYRATGSKADILLLQWRLGTTARELGQLEEARKRLTGVRAGYISLGFGYDAALAGLDLALVYVAEGEPSRLKQLARETLPIFQAQDVHREAMAALMLFAEAARQEAVTAEMVSELIGYLKTVRQQAPERVS